MNPGPTLADRDECPFAHRPKQHDAKNVIPPPETANDATKLSGSLDGQSLHLEKMEIPLGNDKVIVHFSAHHLIPGNETWPKTKLYKWMDKREGHVCGDIGYEVVANIEGLPKRLPTLYRRLTT